MGLETECWPAVVMTILLFCSIVVTLHAAAAAIVCRHNNDTKTEFHLMIFLVSDLQINLMNVSFLSL